MDPQHPVTTGAARAAAARGERLTIEPVDQAATARTLTLAEELDDLALEWRYGDSRRRSHERRRRPPSPATIEAINLAHAAAIGVVLAISILVALLTSTP